MKNFLELINEFMSGIAVFDYIHENELMNTEFQKLNIVSSGVYIFFKEIDYGWISDV